MLLISAYGVGGEVPTPLKSYSGWKSAWRRWGLEFHLFDQAQSVGFIPRDP